MIDRRQMMRFRTRAQQLDRAWGTVADTAILDLGVQDTGTEGARWALANRGVDTDALGADALVLLWTVRGAPHAYRRADFAQVAAATAPYSDEDAGKRIFDAAKPLKAAGIGNLAALDEVASRLRTIVTEPTVKGEASGRASAELPEPYLRYCRPCDAVHTYEMPFRLGAARAGLELAPGTSPPILRPLQAFTPAERVDPRFDLVRGYLRLLGPGTPKQVAAFIDTTVRQVKAHWPEDALEVEADGERRWVLAEDEDALRSAAESDDEPLRLLGPYDLFLQARDRETIVPDSARAKRLWPALGRPGAILDAGEITGLWRPRKSGKRFSVLVEPWTPLRAPVREAVTEQAERLAAHRGADLAGVEFTP